MKAIFGSLTSVVLLGIYVHLVRVALLVVNCANDPKCTEYAVSYFNDNMIQALSVISGLVSALVIAVLAITRPGEVPVITQALDRTSSPLTIRIVKIISVFYVIVWFVVGLWAFLVGLYHPNVLPALTNLGQAWFGLAVAAAYAYLGIKPQEGLLPNR